MRHIVHRMLWFSLLIATAAVFSGCGKTGVETTELIDLISGDYNDAIPDINETGNHELCSIPGNSELRFDAGVDDWQALSGDVTFDDTVHLLTVTTDDGESLSVTFQPTNVDLLPIIQPVLGPGTMFLATTGGHGDNGMIVVVSEEEVIFSAGFTSPGHPAIFDLFGFDLIVTPLDNNCPEPEWEEECGMATASTVSFYIDGAESPGVSLGRWPGGTSDGDSLGGEYSFTLYESWRLIESSCVDHPDREYSWSFTWIPGGTELPG